MKAYCYGLGLISFLAPTGLLLPSLAMVDVRFDKWIRFIWPLMGPPGSARDCFLATGVLLHVSDDGGLSDRDLPESCQESLHFRSFSNRQAHVIR